MGRPTVARIDLSALRDNFRLARSLAGGAEPMAVVKSDGYGHGLSAVAAALSDDANKFAVACIEEAQTIRGAGLSHPVALLQGTHAPDDIPVCAERGFEPVLHCQQQIDWVLASPQRPQVWLKVNTGMNRLGFRPPELGRVMAALQGASVTVLGFVTHFACADDAESAMTTEQTRVFEAAVAPWPNLMRSVGNSAAHFRPKQSMFDWSRPGIMLYGGSPMVGKWGPELGLKPVMTLQAPLIATRTVQAGESVGYGAACVAERPTRMGMVAIGYGDGYPRHAGTGTPAAIGGTRIQLLGRVSMDMLAVDLTNTPQAGEGSMVELWGPTVSVDEVAARAGTIGYELTCSITRRVQFVER
ncbi:MAG: alanine racemase [Marinobacter sp. 34-60-7]|nr:MAG: alanine racemase [Marinobacter sp. 34-60-7]